MSIRHVRLVFVFATLLAISLVGSAQVRVTPSRQQVGGTFTAGGNITTSGGDFVGSSAGGIYPSGSSKVYVWAPLAGQLNLAVAPALTVGVGLDFTSDALLRIRTRAQTGDGDLTAGTITAASLAVNGGGDIVGQGSVFAGAAQRIAFTGRGGLAASANGAFVLRDNGTTIGSEFKVDALPTVSACGAGSPAVTAGSTPMSGSVTIGTTSVASCLITFNGTAYPSAAHCSGAVETTTAANARTMGYLASTTTLTIVPTAAWVDSSVVNWTCISPK